MKNFRTYQIAVEFYRLSSKQRLSGHLKDQFHRAASSIVLNLAEGAGRFGVKDQKKFFSIAFASLRECQAILTLAEMDCPDLEATGDKLAAHLYKLIRS